MEHFYICAADASLVYGDTQSARRWLWAAYKVCQCEGDRVAILQRLSDMTAKRR